MRKEIAKPKQRLIIRKCHMCGQVVESAKEQQKCVCCGKSFLPLNYFSKVHEHDPNKYHELFADGRDLEDEDLVKGVFALW